jgi:hypothetical protein
MGKVWVLDTETKGTGAEMVPLEKLLERRRTAPGQERIKVIRRKPDPEVGEGPEREAVAPREPRRFRVVDAVSRQVLVEDAGARDTVAALAGARSVVEVRIDVWDPAVEEWRPLSLREKKALWAFRGRAADPA